ncbi:hypothetical protein [Sphingobacterium yanglingense]|uniref:Uncharacterized protein n=1 Tax=Sphingobacterium yanglingense TaxID=1437280 RepID=A0A4R6WS33_9SPHI|nr:hypothetical protein [Sphingobacterium yanglingense]TDQ79466.1 hypothetical protein CLV99_0904 [Sphingobacterium yanglingense]
MDIVKHITTHTERLRADLAQASSEQLQGIRTMTLRFFFLLPDFEGIVRQYINIEINREQLLADIDSDTLEYYQQAIEVSNAQVDVYADDYEELEQLELFVLNAFEYATTGSNPMDAAVNLLLEIIDTLDYYENFSENPEYWNKLLEEEIAFQNELLEQVKANERIPMDSYDQRYRKVPFTSC